MIRINQKGDFSKTIKYLQSVNNKNVIPILERYGKEGVNALAAATPVNTGITANAWYYEVQKTKVDTLYHSTTQIFKMEYQ